MTNDVILRIYADLLEEYGDDLPDFEHEPKQFAYILKLYLYYGQRAI